MGSGETDHTRVFVYLVQQRQGRERVRRTGPLLGFGSLIDPWMVGLHPAAAAAVLAEGVYRSHRLRCQILAPDGGVQVIDGDVVASTAPWPEPPVLVPGPLAAATQRPAPEGEPVGIFLDAVSAAPPDQVPWVVPRTDPANLDPLVRFLANAAATDPSGPPLPPPQEGTHGDHEGRHVFPGLGPPWCSWWPHAWGCH